MSQSEIEQELAFQLKVLGIGFEREVKLIEGRRWRFDFRVVGSDLLIEVDGGTFSGGRHTRGKGYEQGCEKQAAAMCLGFKVLRVTSDQVRSGQAAQWVEQIAGVLNTA
jgi:very-short-patch-repair endonuclease